jgi:hypothetical protein
MCSSPLICHIKAGKETGNDQEIRRKKAESFLQKLSTEKIERGNTGVASFHYQEMHFVISIPTHRFCKIYTYHPSVL